MVKLKMKLEGQLESQICENVTKVCFGYSFPIDEIRVVAAAELVNYVSLHLKPRMRYCDVSVLANLARVFAPERTVVDFTNGHVEMIRVPLTSFDVSIELTP